MGMLSGGGAGGAAGGGAPGAPGAAPGPGGGAAPDMSAMLQGLSSMLDAGWGGVERGI